MIIGLSGSEAERKSFVQSFDANLSGLGVTVVTRLGGIDFSKEISEESVREEIKGKNIDAIIVSSFVAVDTSTKYVQGNTNYIPNYVPGGFYGPYSYYGNFYRYYRQSYTTVHTPGYLDATKVVRIETNVYSMKDGSLVWSAVSETVDPSSSGAVIASVTAGLSSKLRKYGYF